MFAHEWEILLDQFGFFDKQINIPYDVYSIDYHSNATFKCLSNRTSELSDNLITNTHTHTHSIVDRLSTRHAFPDHKAIIGGASREKTPQRDDTAIGRVCLQLNVWRRFLCNEVTGIYLYIENGNEIEIRICKKKVYICYEYL